MAIRTERSLAMPDNGVFGFLGVIEPERASPTREPFRRPSWLTAAAKAEGAHAAAFSRRYASRLHNRHLRRPVSVMDLRFIPAPDSRICRYRRSRVVGPRLLRHFSAFPQSTPPTMGRQASRLSAIAERRDAWRPIVGGVDCGKAEKWRNRRGPTTLLRRYLQIRESGAGMKRKSITETGRRRCLLCKREAYRREKAAA